MKQKMIRLIPVFFVLFAPFGFGQETITVSVGEELKLRAAHDGTPPFTYLWYKDGVPIPEATGIEYLVNTQLPGDAVYLVEVSNSFGRANSNNLSCKIVVLPKKAIDTYRVISMWSAFRKDIVFIGYLKPLWFVERGGRA